MDTGLQERTAIVCGASSGLGLAISEALAREGANVVMTARRRELLEREAERIGGLAVPGDLTDQAHLAALVETAATAYGGIDVLVLNGGGPPTGPAVGITADDVEAAVRLLLLPHVRLVAHCLPYLRSSDQARIVAVESTSVREPLPNLALSNTVRPGVVGWLKSLARELGPDGVTVNVIAPGPVDTERFRDVYPDGIADRNLAAIPLGRIGSPDEVAATACFLASARASYVTGAVVPVDGGLVRGLG
jgi:3-oxoacyl-[acyl-carrier protein] reductase